MSSSSSTKACFNYSCKQVVERPRKGWRRRTGEFAELCDRCASAYEDGKFCESFHMNASGWRCCESCGKQIHCGCIVSFHMFVLLDAGGIECMSCARKSFILTPNPAWPPPSLTLPVHPERIRDISAKNWTPSTGSGQAPWRQSHNFLNSGAIVQSELQRRLPSEVEKLGSVERPLSFASIEKKKDDPFERSMNGNLKIVESRTIENGIAGIMREEPLKSCVNFPQQSLFSKNDLPTPQLTSNASSALRNETIDKNKIIGTNAQKSIPLPLAGKQLCSQNGVDSAAGEAQTRNPKPRDARGRGQLLPRYWPRVTDQELQQISGDLNSVITPLFEKMLSASDAGRIGRLVLPKKCAEAYFPPISSSEGLPLKVQDLKGKEWVFQFRFWPNNNSRMYVLEGVTPCIQSMQLQAGDIVTFSRVEPEGKLVMGCRKISTSPPDQAANSADAVNTLSESEKKGQIVKENSGVGKRKNSILGSKSKRIRVENEGTLELNVTFAQAQELLRSSPNNVPTIVVIEGIEIEEYEQDAPIIGRPSIFATEHTGGEIQWAQCESCFKWRKVPASALLPAQWTCSANTWDPERSACSAAQELRSEQLQDLLPNLLSTNKPSKKTKTAKDDPDSTELDALANLAIQDGEEASMPSSSSSPLAATTTSAITTTKHPRHRPGCSCIVCIQPPSGKGPKHKQSCMCNVCETVKRRFRTQMINRVKKQSEMLGGQNRKESFGSPFKGNFDLNIRPEREEELSPGSDSGSPPTRLLTNGTETCVAQRRCSSLLANPDENGGNCQGATAEHRANALASTSATR